MNKPRTDASARRERKPAGPRSTQEGPQLQPPPTGSKRGSPVAPVMKQFAKTKAESSGRS